jgi:hypothetical protein
VFHLQEKKGARKRDAVTPHVHTVTWLEEESEGKRERVTILPMRMERVDFSLLWACLVRLFSDQLI